jgi:8-oxo-dGTP pyrophosphatase MutT (NUDIX family)
VAVVLVDSDPLRHADSTVGAPGGAAFLLCQRAADLRRHAGQWALPGGRVEADETALEAALRELDEELGVRLAPETVIGWLDDYPTRSGYVITPVVVWGGSDPPLEPAQDEVLAVYRVSLETLARAEPRFVAIPESDRPVLQLPLEGHLLHAPTGAILYQLRQVGLLGRAGERVDELEQPVFAWS